MRSGGEEERGLGEEGRGVEVRFLFAALSDQKRSQLWRFDLKSFSRAESRMTIKTVNLFYFH